jgi:fatty acid desaturase
MNFMHVNVLAVLVAAVLQWIVGWIWYGALFSKPWKALVGQGESEKPSNAGAVMVLILIACIILSFALAELIFLTGWSAFSKGAFAGVVCGLGFVIPPLFAQHIAEKKPFKLFGINAVYWLCAMVLSGGLLAVWH